jgi:hypothetical protein
MIALPAPPGSFSPAGQGQHQAALHGQDVPVMAIATPLLDRRRHVVAPQRVFRHAPTSLKEGA